MVNQKDDGPSWEESSTLAEWCERMLRSGQVNEVEKIIASLPDESKVKIRVRNYLKTLEERKK